MNAFTDWLAMGGYGWYVWLSYAAGLLVLVVNVWLPLRYHRRLTKRRASGGGG